MPSATRSQKSQKSKMAPKKKASSKQTQNPGNNSKTRHTRQSQQNVDDNNTENNQGSPGPTNTQSQTETSQPLSKKNHRKAGKAFRSRFPGLELDNFEEELPKWTLVSLREAIFHQQSRRSTAHKDIKDLVKIMRMEFEKRILMIALMAGVPEVVIWNLVGFGSKKTKANPWIRFLSFCVKCLGKALPDRDDKDAWVDHNQDMSNKWHTLSKDQKNVFRDPYFFALADLPDYASHDPEEENTDVDEENGVNVQSFDTVTPAPQVYKLSDAEKDKYQPLFDELVNIEKVHLCHGKPEPLPTIATLQKKSLIAVKKAHHDFAVVCQQNQIAYYLTTASCGGVDGWSQTYSNDVWFAKWAVDTAQVPQKFSTYIHGKDTAKEIEGSTRQPSDQGRSLLGKRLNEMLGVHVRGGVFPKKPNPVAAIEAKGWPVKIVQKAGSMLNRCDLDIGHRKVPYAVVKLWSKDIENGNFTIVKTGNEQLEDAPNQSESRSTVGKKRKHEALKDTGSKAMQAGPSESRRRLEELARGDRTQYESRRQKKINKRHKSSRSDSDEDSDEESDKESDENSDEESDKESDENSDEESESGC
ncbi:uncharacterized protein MELLADRAFT_90762 [Melampsora larici-populina 98AG31]|uniref:Uncharacterized protein n=1 Tax=Melampsora larici-populina (strain 98AG31 / pathotype 3-4-7) TaxID=747676 RepID=F4R7E1_MELLP|nr:uncharacterized protein MELLADRAFT_90762 [Melampsora larici-populina 98AG31]EGG11803.1 hypothetical protein MELLADRAFT_90762 [Melampsora larici-populina 98AG31]